MYLQKSNHATFPKLRFPHFGKDWEVLYLSEVFSNKSKKNSSNIVKNVLTNSANEGIVNQRDYFDKDIANQGNLTNYYIVDLNDFVYNPRISRAAPVGPLKRNKLGQGIMSPLYTVLKPKKGEFDYLEKYFESSKWHRFMYKIANYGARHDRMSILQLDFFRMPVPFPLIEEQQKIASFLTSVDDWIENWKKQKYALDKYKKGMMQKIFSQKIRFKDENSKDFPDWEEKKLGDVFYRLTEKNKENNKNVLTISAQFGLINQQDFFKKSVASKDLKGYYLILEGDFAYNKSYSNGYPMGAIKKLNNYKKGIVSTLYICFRIKNNNHSDFFEQYFDFGLQNREIEKIAQEGARNHGLLNISVVDFFEQIYLQVPSYDEQLKIADFLTIIDDLIVLKSKQIEKAEEWKKGLMQQMFV